MIGKLKKGASFGGCVRYVTGKDEAKIIASDTRHECRDNAKFRATEAAKSKD